MNSKKEKLIEYAQKGLYNTEIAILLGIKEATLSSWKKQLRESGVFIPAQKGRPNKGRDIVRGVLD